MACDQVRFSISPAGIAAITLDDPASKNALSNPVIEELARIFFLCEQDESVKLVLLRGAGGAFSSGGNIRTLKEQIDRRAWDKGTLAHLCDAARRLKDLSKPTVCVIEGTAAGAGVGLAMACDFSIAVQGSKFTCAFINLALVPDAGSTELLVRTAGVCRAKELLLLGGVFTAEEAARWGVISWAVPKEALEERVDALCKKLLAASSTAYGRIKTLVNRCAYPDFDGNLLGEAEYQYASLISDDHKEGVCAFLEKRTPDFSRRRHIPGKE